MLTLLQKRYKALCQARFKKAERIEDKLTEIKNEKFDELIVPNTFYCTFMEGAGHQAALTLKQINCEGEEVILKQAKNPSDIIWLNRGVSRPE